jgi:hypothetical protein
MMDVILGVGEPDAVGRDFLETDLTADHRARRLVGTLRHPRPRRGEMLGSHAHLLESSEDIQV